MKKFLAILLLVCALPMSASSNRKWVGFYIAWEANGTDATVVIDFANDPVAYSPSSGALLSSLFSGLPADATHISVSGATLSTSSYSSLTHKLTVTFTSAPTAGTEGNIQGHAEYN